MLNWPVALATRPSLILAFFVKSAAAEGSFSQNPIKLANLNVTSAVAHYNGTNYPSQAFTPVWDNVSESNYKVSS